MNFSRYLTLEAELRQNYLMLQIKKTKVQLNFEKLDRHFRDILCIFMYMRYT